MYCDEEYINGDITKMDEEITLQKLAAETSLHGMRYLSLRTIKVRKLFWILLLLGVTSFCLFNIVDTLQRYLEYDSYYSTKEVLKSLVYYPAVSICNVNIYNRTAVRVYSKVLYEFIYDNSIATANATVAQQLHSINALDSFMKAGFSEDEVFVRCVIGAYGHLNCKDFITRLPSEFGLCYTYNGLNIPSRIKATGPGTDQGMSLTLDLNLAQFMTTTKNSNGFLLVIHSPNEYPDFSSRSMLLKPGTSTMIGMKKVVKTTLPQPYSNENCLSDTIEASSRLADAMAYYSLPFSKSLCLTNCRVHQILAQNTCNILKHGTDGCSVLNYVQFGRTGLDQLYSGNVSAAEICRFCLSNCTTTSYTWQATSGDYPNPVAESELMYFRPHYTTTAARRENLLEVILFYETLDVTYLEQKQAMTSSQLYSNIGGLLGLFLGASFMTVAEFIDFVVMVIIKKCSKRQHQVTKVKPAETGIN